MTPLKTSEQIAHDMLRQCAERALWRLQQSEPDVKTVAMQLSETARLALAEIDEEAKLGNVGRR